MNADAQTTATCGECRYVPMGNAERGEAFIRLCSRHAHVDALAAQNGELVQALRAEHDAHIDIRYDGHFLSRWVKGPMDRHRQNNPNCAICALPAGQPVDTEAERLRGFLRHTSIHYHTTNLYGLQIPDLTATAGEAGDTEAELVRGRARERRG